MIRGLRWGIVILLGGSSALLAACDGPVDVGESGITSTTAAPATSSPRTGPLWGTEVRPPIGIEPFTLTDQEGQPFTFPRDVGRAEVTLLYFGYTHCPDICPDTMAEISVALREVPPEVAERVAVVFVTVDPTRDDPARLREWLGLFNEGFIGLTGPLARIEAVELALGYRPGLVADLGGGEYVVGHPADYLAIAPDGTVRLTYPWEITVTQLEGDLTRLVEEGSDG